jgi:long-chain acyl-CoA synthetase
MTDLGCALSGVTVVTLYDTLGKDSIEYILDQTEMKTVTCSADKIKTLLELKKEGKIKTMTNIIYYDDAK